MKNRELRTDISVFFLIFLTSSYVVTNDIISSNVTIAGWVILLLYSLWNLRNFDKTIFLTSVPLILLFVVSSMVNREPSFKTGALAFSYIAAALLAMGYTLHGFKVSFVKIMYYLSVISLILFPLYLLIPKLSEINVVYNTVGTPASNLVLYIGNDYERNMGMFWEPGAFQAFVSIALLFCVLDETINFKKLLVFVATIITTFSTTGYFAVAVVIYFIVKRWNTIDRSSKKLLKYLAFPMIALFLVLSADALFDTSSNSVFGKLIAFNENKGFEGQVEGGSVGIRYFAIIKPIQAFIESPIFGKGYDGLANELLMFTRGMNTCTFINWFAMYGIGYGLLMTIGMIRFGKQINPKHAWLMFLFLFIITISENFATNAFFFMLAMIGYKSQLNSNLRYGNIRNYSNVQTV